MKQKKILRIPYRGEPDGARPCEAFDMRYARMGMLFAFALSLSLLVGCGGSTGKQETKRTAGVAETIVETEQQSADQTTAAVDENQEAAEQLLVNLTGSYQELWPVLLEEEYQQIWLEDSAALVGEENAEDAVKLLQSMVTGEIYGEEAVEAYKDGDMAYFCGFTQALEKLQFDGSTIDGSDASGNGLFSHSYHYIGMEEMRGLYIFESDDTDSGEFTHFFLAPDTSETTYHIEFRYGSDYDALCQYDAGEYAYWLASGISVDYDRTMIEKAINLFCTENLSE